MVLMLVKRLSNTEFHTQLFPNAGLPDQTPEEMRDLIKEYLKSNSVNMEAVVEQHLIILDCFRN